MWQAAMLSKADPGLAADESACTPGKVRRAIRAGRLPHDLIVAAGERANRHPLGCRLMPVGGAEW
jgi:hypothetical protein